MARLVDAARSMGGCVFAVVVVVVVVVVMEGQGGCRGGQCRRKSHQLVAAGLLANRAWDSSWRGEVSKIDQSWELNLGSCFSQ
jgi:hypothetical protein